MGYDQDAVNRQLGYYAQTADKYDELHLQEMRHGLQYLRLFLEMHKCETVLDVGSGTGNVIQFLRENGIRSVEGVEPSEELISRAIAKGVPPGVISKGDGGSLPFADGSFDAVCEVGVLHHVREPSLIVAEMIRTARRMVVLCDSNRFGQGSWPMRLLKLSLHKAGLWDLADYIRTGGKHYMESEGDGVFYSYSVYDSLHQLSRWADSIVILPSTEEHQTSSWFQPLLTAPGAILVAVKNTN